MIDVNEKAVNLVKKSLLKNKIDNANVFISDVYENIKNKKMGVNRKFLWKGKSER